MTQIDPRRRFRAPLFNWQGPGLHCRVVQASRVLLDAGWSYTLRDDFWRLYCNHHAGATLTCGGRRIALAAGTCYLIPSQVEVVTACRGRVGHLFVHFVPVGWDAGVAGELFREVVALPADAARDRLLRRIGESAWDAPQWIHLQAEVLHALADLVAAQPAADQARLCGGGVAHHPALAACLRLIESRLDRPLTVAGIASACGLTPQHLSRLFRAELGIGPQQWLHRRRSEVAADLMVSTDCTIAEAARRTGFANRYHFSRIFTRMLGVAPAAYRRREAGHLAQAAE
jgi:AraC family transcriptional regulator